MNISLQNFSRNELIDFLTFFDDSFLLKPIVDNTKYFNKNPNTKKWIDGYRITKLPTKNIYEIYVNEIMSQTGTPLEQTLLAIVDGYFNDIKIEEIIKNEELNDFAKILQIQSAIAIKPLTSKDNNLITVLQVNKLCGINLDAAVLEKVEAVSQVITSVIETLRSQQDQAITDCKEKADTAIKELQEQIEKLTEDCGEYSNKVAEFKTEIEKLRSQLDESEQKVKAATDMVGELNLDQARIKVAKKELCGLQEQKINLEKEICVKKEKEESQLNILKDNIAETKKKIQEINTEKQLETSKLEKLKSEITEIDKTRDNMLEELAKREEISAEIDKRVKNKLQNTKNCIAEFFSNYSLYTYNNTQITTPVTTTETHTKSMIKGMKVEDAPYEIMSETDLIECLKENLVEAGVMKDKNEMLAAYLLAAYNNKMPLILAGANADDIADAVSITLQNKTANRITCNNEKGIPIKSESREITILYDAIGTRSMVQVLKVCTEKHGYFYYEVESADELAIESKGLFNYAVPLFTDFFVDKRASRLWNGCYCNLELNVSSYEKVMMSIPKNLVSPLTYNICHDLMMQYATYKKNFEIFDGFILQTLPIMIILGKTEELVDIINNGRLSDNDKNFLLMLCGEK